jgi:hypothetical protein
LTPNCGHWSARSIGRIPPSWQGLSSRPQAGRCSHVFGVVSAAHKAPVKKLILHRVLTHASRRALHVQVAHRKRRTEEISHEGLVSYRSAVRSRDLCNDSDLTAGDATRCRAERRSSASCHVSACSGDGTPGGKTRASARAAGYPSRLLILFGRQCRYSEIGERLLEGLP